MHKENEKGKEGRGVREKPSQKKVLKRFDNFAMGKLRKHNAKGSQKDKDVDVDFQLPTLKTPGN